MYHAKPGWSERVFVPYYAAWPTRWSDPGNERLGALAAVFPIRASRDRSVRDLDADRADGLVRAEPGPARHRAAVQCAADRPAMGHQRIHAFDRRADGDRGPPRRHLRTP